MTSWLKQILSYFLGQFAYRYLFSQLKKKVVVTYLKTLKVIRQSLLAAVLLLVTLQLMTLGLVGVMVSSIWLYPTDDLQTKLWILFALSLTLFLVPGLGLFLFFSEKMWLQMSGAEKLLSETN